MYIDFKYLVICFSLSVFLLYLTYSSIVMFDEHKDLLRREKVHKLQTVAVSVLQVTAMVFRFHFLEC